MELTIAIRKQYSPLNLLLFFSVLFSTHGIQ